MTIITSQKGIINEHHKSMAVYTMGPHTLGPHTLGHDTLVPHTTGHDTGQIQEQRFRSSIYTQISRNSQPKYDRV